VIVAYVCACGRPVFVGVRHECAPTRRVKCPSCPLVNGCAHVCGWKVGVGRSGESRPSGGARCPVGVSATPYPTHTEGQA
jgi:hypothetical protein